MTKKQVLIFSTIAAVIFSVLYSNYLPNTYCIARSVCTESFKIAKIIFLISMALLPMVIFISMFQEKIFSVWKKFTFIYLFIYLFSIIIAPTYGADFINIEKGTVAITLSILYVVISVLLILYKSWKLKKSQE